MLIQLTGSAPQVLKGRSFFGGQFLNLPDAEAQTLLDAKQATRARQVKMLRVYRHNEGRGPVFNPGELAAFDQATADMLVQAGAAVLQPDPPCSTPS